jgi:hypothetical protein
MRTPGIVGLSAWLGMMATASPAAPQALDKVDFVRNYQGKFGGIKVPGCGFHHDTMFDPVSLLVTWTRNRPCFERAMQAHGRGATTASSWIRAPITTAGKAGTARSLARPCDVCPISQRRPGSHEQSRRAFQGPRVHGR